VTASEEQRLPELLAWAAAAKSHIAGELEAAGVELRGPLAFRGQGPKRDPGEAGGGVQTVAQVGSAPHLTE